MEGVVHKQKGAYLLSDPEPGSLKGVRELLDLLSLGNEEGIGALLIQEGSLPPEFFDLSSGLAGQIALKLSTYRVKTAVVVDLEGIPSRHFRSWAGECNRGREIRFCSTMGEAEDWLLSP
jgi:hypothetical protein